MPKRGKQYRAMHAQIDRNKGYHALEAVDLLKKSSFAKFDETVEIALNLGVNPRHADQMVRGAVVYPNGLGKEVKVLVFAKGEKEIEARDAGADFVGGMDYVTKIKDEGWLGFDKVIATPDMMGIVGRIARILGPRGLMPNPKVNTVTLDVNNAVKEMKSGRAEFRVDKAGIVHVPIGKISFENTALVENLIALMEMIMRMKPATSKGVYLKRVTLSSTMGPGISLDTSALISQIQ
jgi:large subunit ribosomal protein L1